MRNKTTPLNLNKSKIQRFKDKIQLIAEDNLLDSSYGMDMLLNDVKNSLNKDRRIVGFNAEGVYTIR